MARDGKEERVREVEYCIAVWKEYQQRYSADEAFFHYSQSVVDKLESKLDVLTRVENWNEYIRI